MKRILVVMLALMLVFSFGSSVFADENANASNTNSNEENAIKIANKANHEIEKLIHMAVKAGDKLQKDYAKGEIDEVAYNEALDQLIAGLDQVTKAITNEAITRIGNLGFEAECTYVNVQIADRTVPIDPVRVVGGEFVK